MNLDSMEFILEMIHLKIKDGAYIRNFDKKMLRTKLLCIVQILKLFFLTVLELNMFLKKLKNLLGIKV